MLLVNMVFRTSGLSSSNPDKDLSTCNTKMKVSSVVVREAFDAKVSISSERIIGE